MLNLFISPPYNKCPRCSNTSLGVEFIRSDHYTQRCKDCSYPHGTKDKLCFSLPALDKKIIYLDQFVISNMVKSLHPEFKKKLDPFYLKAFEKLDRLSKLQLIVCPDSQFHEDESELAKFPKEHKRVYELLSHGVTFHDRWQILARQVAEHLNNWLGKTPNSETKFSIHDVTFGEINTWNERIMLTVTTDRGQEHSKQLRANKEEVHRELKPALEHWHQTKGKDFAYWHQQELLGWRDNFEIPYKTWMEQIKSLSQGKTPTSFFSLLPSPFAEIYKFTAEKIISAHSDKDEARKALQDFLSPESLVNVPFIRLISMIFAGLATKLSDGMKVESVGSSFMSDAIMMATITPFCDAIFTEKFLTGIFNETPTGQCLTKMPEIFSLNTKDNFLVYLDKIEAAASARHIQKVEEVYGKDWATPYLNVLQHFEKE